MGRTLDLCIALGTIAVALFGIGSGSFIYVQFSGAALGLGILTASALGGLLGVAKFVRTRTRSGARRNTNRRSERTHRL
jgi:hypothetical protein